MPLLSMPLCPLAHLGGGSCYPRDDMEPCLSQSGDASEQPPTVEKGAIHWQIEVPHQMLSDPLGNRVYGSHQRRWAPQFTQLSADWLSHHPLASAESKETCAPAYLHQQLVDDGSALVTSGRATPCSTQSIKLVHKEDAGCVVADDVKRLADAPRTHTRVDIVKVSACQNPQQHRPCKAKSGREGVTSAVIWVSRSTIRFHFLMGEWPMRVSCWPWDRKGFDLIQASNGLLLLLLLLVALLGIARCSWGYCPLQA